MGAKMHTVYFQMESWAVSQTTKNTLLHMPNYYSTNSSIRNTAYCTLCFSGWRLEFALNMYYLATGNLQNNLHRKAGHIPNRMTLLVHHSSFLTSVLP